MEEKRVLDHNLTISEEYKIFDKLAQQMKGGVRGPLGWVQIFLQTKHGLIFDEGPNLVVAQGREYVAQRAFGEYSGEDWTEYLITHFAVGSGGSTISDGPSIALNGPHICDTELLDAGLFLDGAVKMSLGVEGYLTEPSGVEKAVKPIDTVSPEQVTYTDTPHGDCYNYTKMKCTCIVADEEPEGIVAGDSVKIDEAGLYFVSGSTALMFSHICFAPKWKEKESTLTIQWYILF